MDFVEILNKILGSSDKEEKETDLYYNPDPFYEEDIDFKNELLDYLSGIKTKESLIKIYYNSYGAIFNNAILLFIEDLIDKENLFKIIKDETFNQSDIGKVFVAKKSFMDINFYNKMLSLNCKIIDDMVVYGSSTALIYSLSNNYKNEFIEFYFNDEDMCHRMYEKIKKDIKEEDFEREEDKKFIRDLLLRSKLSYNLEKKEKTYKQKFKDKL